MPSWCEGDTAPGPQVMRAITSSEAKEWCGYEDLVSFVTLGVLFLWDVHVAGARGQLLFYSHDEFGWIES